LQEENLTLAKQNLESNKKDLELMKDYATTAEVWPPLLDPAEREGWVPGEAIFHSMSAYLTGNVMQTALSS